jgi:deoxyribodipyrimidine photo-lyase
MIYGIYIFRRDLRLDDNHGLINLMKKCDKVIPMFYLDENQIIKSDHNQYYFSNNAVQFMCESLEDLDQQLNEKNSKLFYFLGHPDIILENILKQLNDYKIVVGWNADYSKYSLNRDGKMKNICKKYDVEVLETFTDFTLVPFEKLIKSDGNAFKQYGAFYKNTLKTTVCKTIKNNNSNYISKTFKLRNEFKKTLQQFYNENKSIAQHGGRLEALQKLKRLVKFKEYNVMRDRLDYETTNISAALNFGCISIREAYQAIIKHLGKNSTLLKQLYWRDFFLTIVKHTPHGNDFKRHIDERYDLLDWHNSRSVKYWQNMWDSKTGFLLIDAGMNQMKISGFLHNRLRMLLGVFWTKYLLINPFHPKYGSQVGFSQLLVDAVGPSQNAKNHAWITELDFPGKKFSAKGVPLSGRPMDISNKMIRKWDPECIYIKRWLPHLKDIPKKELYNWQGNDLHLHPGPIFDPKEKYKEWIQLCKG